jgi:hypothetical protein
MALNVNWNWRMPAVADPDKVAAGNRQDFLSGLDSLASGLIKKGENQRADEKQKWLETTNARDYAEKVRQFDEKTALDKLNADRNYQLQLDQFNLNKAKQLNDIERQKRQDEYLKKLYESYFSNDPEQQELQRLLAKYQGGDAAAVMIGLNPQLLKMR